MGKKGIMAVILGGFALWAGTACWAGDRFEYCQERQLRQIADGVRTGRITQREFKYLNEEQCAIREARKKGGYNYKTRTQLDCMQKRAETSIYTAIHNSWTILSVGRISGTATYGTTIPRYGYRNTCQPSYESCLPRYNPRRPPRAIILPSRYSGRAVGTYRGSRSSVRATVCW